MADNWLEVCQISLLITASQSFFFSEQCFLAYSLGSVIWYENSTQFDAAKKPNSAFHEI